MLDLAEAYAETKSHLADLVRDLPEDRLTLTVPASPDWSVRDVAAHVTGLANLAVNGEIPPELDIVASLYDPGQASKRDTVADSTVERRRGRSIQEILDEWDAAMPDFVPMLRGERPFPGGVPFADAILVTDVSVHAQDVRGAPGVPGDRDSAGVSVSLVSYLTALRLRIGLQGLPPMRVVYGGRERVVGDGEPAATWEGDRFEICRALSGRRSSDQIRAMAWTGDPEPYISLIPAYGPRSDPITE